MKRTSAFLLVLVLLLNIAGCHTPEEVPNTQPPKTEPSTMSTTEDTPFPSTEPTEPAASLSTQSTTQTEPVVTQPPIVDPEPEDADFVRVIDYIPAIRQALPYATVNNFTDCRIYDFTDAYLRYGTVKKLMSVCEELAAQGIGLKIWDGFRPVAAQEKLWEICPDPTFVSHPVTGSRSHCRGNTVDITLVDLSTGEDLPVPTGFDNFTAYADRDYSDCSPAAAKNARLLEQAMKKHGFKTYFAEWWHFTDTTDYPVDETFDPSFPTVWTANCQQYISLRSAANSSQVIAQIPAGAEVTLLGWDGKYAKVDYKGQEGYAMASYLAPEAEDYLTNSLGTVMPTDVYSYEQMLTDITALHTRYPELVSVETVGVSEAGREIPVIRIGDLDARYHVLFQGAIHGREHMTAWLLMALADYWLSHDILSYGDVCYHIIPMSNPDGVMISQSGTLNDTQKEIYLKDKQLGHTTLNEADYARLWKANALGVDLNRNFPAGWEHINSRTGPSSQQYQGEVPFCAAEAAALRDYTLRYAFDATISYHASGSLIYYEYGSKQAVNDRSFSLAKALQKITGYAPEGSSSVDGAGYKDWAIDALEIPSLTIEIGCGDAPLAERELFSIFVRNYRILPEIARWLQH